MNEPGFADTETTGLDPDPDVHEVWEVAVILDDERLCWQLPVNEDRADPQALDMNGYRTRRWPAAETPAERVRAVAGRCTAERPDGPGVTVHPDDMADWAARLCKLADGRPFAGGNFSFDEERLRRLCLRYGERLEMHYRPLCAQQILYGYLLGLRAAGSLPPDLESVLTVPWHSDSLLAAIGVAVDRGRHTAMGDAEMFQRAWRLVHEGTIPS